MSHANTKPRQPSSAALGFAFILSIASVCIPAVVQAQIPTFAERVKTYSDVKPLDDSAFGERVGFYKGELSFFQTDLTLNGQGPDIVVGRSYSMFPDIPSSHPPGFSDWGINIPRIVTRTPRDPLWGTDGNRCPLFTGGYAPHAGGNRAWWNGYQLVDAMGDVREPLGRVSENSQAPGNQPANYPALTMDNWQISCLAHTANGMTGKAFLATAPDGTRYWFDWLVLSRDSTWADAVIQPDHGPTVHDVIYTGMMLVTRIEDRFGNYLTYSYDGDRLLSITASDGRSVSFTWDSGNTRITHMTSSAHSWAYGYGTISSSNSSTLTSVGYPDGKSEIIDLSGLKYDGLAWQNDGGCSLYSMPQGPLHTGTMTLPSGLKGTFSVREIQKGRAKVPYYCYTYNFMNYIQTPADYSAISIVKRTYIGAGVSRTWSYSYGPINASWETTCGTGCAKTVYVDETAPGGRVTRYTYSNEWGPHEGKLLSVEENRGGSGGTKLTTYTYAPTSGMPYPDRIGEAFATMPAPMPAPAPKTNTQNLEMLSPVSKKVITQDGGEFIMQVSTFDSFGRPSKIIEKSQPSP